MSGLAAARGEWHSAGPDKDKLKDWLEFFAHETALDVLEVSLWGDTLERLGARKAN